MRDENRNAAEALACTLYGWATDDRAYRVGVIKPFLDAAERRGALWGLEMAWGIVNSQIYDLNHSQPFVEHAATLGHLKVVRNEIRRAFEAKGKEEKP